MACIDERIQRIRRMSTYRAFVWGLRLVLLALLLLIAAVLAPDAVLPFILVLCVGGLLLGIPFRVLAYWKLDVPYVLLFRQAMHDATPPLLRHWTTIRFHIRNPTLVRLAERVAVPGPVEDHPAASQKDKLNKVRMSWPYRTNVWGYRIMLASLVPFCGATIVPGSPTWLVTWPILTLIAGFLMTIPLRWDTSRRLPIPAGHIMLHALRDTFNPTFH